MLPIAHGGCTDTVRHLFLLLFLLPIQYERDRVGARKDSPSVTSLMVSVNVKHHVYFLAQKELDSTDSGFRVHEDAVHI